MKMQKGSSFPKYPLVWLVGGEGRCFEKSFYILFPARFIPPKAILLGKKNGKCRCPGERAWSEEEDPCLSCLSSLSPGIENEGNQDKRDCFINSE